MSSPSVNVTTALRLGWAVAEARGRNWPLGPRPVTSSLPAYPGDVLPLRCQRASAASREESASTVVRLAEQLELGGTSELEDDIRTALPPFDRDGDATLVDDGLFRSDQWRRTADFFIAWDSRFQDELAGHGEQLANAYLLGRGLSECFWGLGPERTWVVDGQTTATSLAFLFGDERRRELTRMLGRLGGDDVHPMTAAVIAGSLEAWRAVADSPAWSRAADLRPQLYEQVRGWYQLLVLGQDPTTLIRPYAKLAGLRGLGRAARLFWPQVVLALVALGLVTTFFAVVGGSGPPWVSSLLASTGVSVFVVAGLLARGQSAAQRLLTRVRQDAYTDLVALSVTIVPTAPAELRGASETSWRAVRNRLEPIVRQRLLTPPTAPPPG